MGVLPTDSRMLVRKTFEAGKVRQQHLNGPVDQQERQASQMNKQAVIREKQVQKSAENFRAECFRRQEEQKRRRKKHSGGEALPDEVQSDSAEETFAADGGVQVHIDITL